MAAAASSDIFAAASSAAFAAASSDVYPTFPTTLPAFESAAASNAYASNVLASTEYGCPGVSTISSTLSVLHGGTNCTSCPEFPQHCIVSPLTAATTAIALVDVYCCLVLLFTLFTMRRVEKANHTPVRLRLLRIRVSPDNQCTFLCSQRYHRYGR